MVKTKTLEFLDNHIEMFQELSVSREKAIWECYDLLLEFRNDLNEIREGNDDHKKSHRSGIKDFHLRHLALL